MIVVMKTGATEGQVKAIQKHIKELGFKDHLSRGAERTVIGVL
ncbi:MAG: 3-deoxy-7-phosphoheptulonate synthase, partial [Gemmatimonadetes bacterium]|nr:3-deoxy-7-phosphoheptulonate synthase [Gemmatimonadota bacterium]